MRLRRTASASAFARTRIAWSRGGAPDAIRAAISAAIQSASSEPVAKARWRTGAAAAARRAPRFAALRDEPLRDPSLDLQAIRVVEADQAVGGIEDRGPRAVVAAQDDRPRAPEAIEEVDDRPGRRAAEAVDRLVVVADHGDVAARLGHERDELGLGPVHVLELVHEHVPEAGLQLRSRGRMLTQEPQGEGHLVAEVDGPGLAEQLLVAPVRGGELRLAAGRLAARLAGRVVPGAGRRRPASASTARRAACAVNAAGETSSSFSREKRVARASRKRVGFPSGRYASRSSRKSRSARKMTVSGRDRTRGSDGRPSSRACSRITRSPKAWKVEMTVSV